MAEVETPILPSRGTNSTAVVVPPAAVPAAVIPGVAGARPGTAAASANLQSLGTLAVPANETVLENGIVIPSKKDLAAKPIEELKAIFSDGLKALTKQIESLRDKLPNLGFSGGAGQNIESLVTEKSGRDGGVWAAGMRTRSPDLKTFVSDLVNSAADASSYTSLDPGTHRSGTYTLGGIAVLNLDNAKNKGNAPARTLSEISAAKYPGGETAERMHVVLNPENYSKAVIGVIPWDKSPAGLNLRSSQDDRTDLVKQFRALYAVSEAVRMTAGTKETPAG